MFNQRSNRIIISYLDAAINMRQPEVGDGNISNKVLVSKKCDEVDSFMKFGRTQ